MLVRRKRARINAMSARIFFTVEVRVEVFPPLYYTAELLAVGTYANA